MVRAKCPTLLAVATLRTTEEQIFLSWLERLEGRSV